MHSKFALYNYAGNELRHYLVEQQPIKIEEVEEVQQFSHHIILVDRSGSMYYEIEDLKDTLLKLLTLEEYECDEMKISLLSYSSKGDVTLHFKKVPVSEVMKKNSTYRKEIQNIRVTGLTCISQALEEAAKLIDDDEVTAITLHSDGYANDPSSGYENRTANRVCEELQGKNVFVNTIAYTSWSDFKFLSNIANKVSGTCVQALNIKTVYDSMHETSDLLMGNVSPAMQFDLGDADYQVFISRSAGKVNGSSGDLLIRGIRNEDDKLIYKFREVDKKTYDKEKLPICGEEEDVVYLEPLIAFAYTNLAEGRLNTAKYALISSRNLTLLDDHARALTNEEIVKFAEDLREAILTNSLAEHDYLLEYGMQSEYMSLLDLVGLMQEHSRDIQISIDDLMDGYVRRSVKRVPGSIEDGVYKELTVKTKRRHNDEYVQLQSFAINRNNATINMLLSQPIDLVSIENGEERVIDKVAGVSLDGLKDFRNYTLVGDGVLNVPTLTVKVTSKKAFRALSKAGVVEGDYEPDTGYIIDLSVRPLVDFEKKFDALDGIFDNVARLRVFSSLLSACLKERSDKLTDDQIAALKKYYVTPALNVSFPTVYGYAADGLSKEEALNKGVIDTRLSYKVNFGSKEILNLSKFPSANKFLDTNYTVEINGEKVAKPKLAGVYFEDGVFFAPKAKKKTNAVYHIVKPIFDDFFGLTDEGVIEALLKDNGVEGAEDALLMIAERAWDSVDEAVEFLAGLRRKVDAKIEDIFRESVCPLIFYIGATGLIPDEFNAAAMTKDEVMQKYPELKPGKPENEASFFEIGDNTILTIYVKEENFSR